MQQANALQLMRGGSYPTLAGQGMLQTDAGKVLSRSTFRQPSKTFTLDSGNKTADLARIVRENWNTADPTSAHMRVGTDSISTGDLDDIVVDWASLRTRTIVGLSEMLGPLTLMPISPALAAGGTILGLIHTVASNAGSSFNPFRWRGTRALLFPTYKELFTRNMPRWQWQRFVRTFLAYDDSTLGLDRVRAIMRRHGITLDTFVHRRHVPKENGTALTGNDVRDIFARRTGIYNPDDIAAWARDIWSARAVGTPLRLDYRNVEGAALYFNELAHHMSGIKPPHITHDWLPKNISTECTPATFRLMRHLPYFRVCAGSGSPLTHAAAAAYLASFYMHNADTDSRTAAMTMIQGIYDYLPGTKSGAVRLYETHRQAMALTEQRGLASLDDEAGFYVHNAIAAAAIADLLPQLIAKKWSSLSPTSSSGKALGAIREAFKHHRNVADEGLTRLARRDAGVAYALGTEVR